MGGRHIHSVVNRSLAEQQRREVLPSDFQPTLRIERCRFRFAAFLPDVQPSLFTFRFQCRLSSPQFSLPLLHHLPGQGARLRQICGVLEDRLGKLQSRVRNEQLVSKVAKHAIREGLSQSVKVSRLLEPRRQGIGVLFKHCRASGQLPSQLGLSRVVQHVRAGCSDLRAVQPREHLTGLHMIAGFDDHLSENSRRRSSHCDVSIVVIRDATRH